jgi:hypothetical protein
MNERAVISSSITEATPPLHITTGPAPSQADRRVQHLLPITALGALLSLLASLSVPVWPKGAPIVGVLVVLVCGALCFLSSFVHKALAIPEVDDTSPRKWLWQYTSTARQYRRNYMRLACSLAAIMYLQGGLMIVLQWWVSTKDWDSFRSGFAQLVTGVTFTIFIALLWGRSGSRIDRALDRPFGVGLMVVMGFALFVGSMVLVTSQIGNLKVGPAASWSEQWRVAQQAVASKYPNAIPISIYASRDYDAPDTYDASLQMTFRFLDQARGLDISVLLRDANPEASTRVWEYNKGLDTEQKYTAEEIAKLNTIFGTIRISPRDARTRAISALKRDAPAVSTGSDIMPWISFYVKDSKMGSNPAFDVLNKEVAWDVLFYDERLPEGKVAYWVDAQTGETLRH